MTSTAKRDSMTGDQRLPTTLQDWVRRAKSLTDAGAAIWFDGEMWGAPRWFISNRTIYFEDKEGGCRQYIFDAAEGCAPEFVMSEMQERLKIYAEVNLLLPEPADRGSPVASSPSNGG